jgi:hypothetical protein
VVWKSVRGPGERLEPPIVVAQAVASVVDGAFDRDGRCHQERHPGRRRGAGHDVGYAALTDAGLVVAEVTNTVVDWEMGTRETDPEPSIGARLIPIREITFCRVDGVTRYSASPDEWSGSWSIGLRGEKPVQLPVGSSRESRDAASDLGDRIAARLRSAR